MWGYSKKKEVEPSGYLGDMNEFQQICLDDLKKHIQENEIKLNPWIDDAFLLRFCRCKKFVLLEVVDMFSKFMTWRQENGIDTIITDYEFKEAEVMMGVF